MKHIKLGILGLLAAVMLATAGPGATPVEAASGVSYCFKHDNGSPANSSSGRATLMGWVSGAWAPLASQRTDIRGCGSWSISGSWRNLYVLVRYSASVGTAYWLGTSPLMALPGTAKPFLGTGVVYRQR